MVVAMAVASLGVHLVLWPVGDQVLQLTWESPPLPPAGGIMEVSLLGPDDDESQDEEPRPDEVPQFPGQLVDPDRVLDERRPEDTDRISAFDSRVEQETKAPSRRKASEYTADQVGPEAGVASAEGRASNDIPEHALPFGRLAPAESPELGVPIDPSDLRGEAFARDNDMAGGTAPPPRPGGRGTMDAMRKTFGGSGSFDDLKGVEEGAESLLNTHRFRFASFFNRMRNQIAQYWDPNEVMGRVDPDGRTYGRRTRKTLVHIQLTPKGKIKKIDLIDDSGVRELDKEAIESVHLAAPFVNPPPQMVDPDTGYIEVDFMFVLQEGRTSIHRYLR